MSLTAQLSISLEADDAAELGRVLQAIGAALASPGQPPSEMAVSTEADVPVPAPTAAEWYAASGSAFLARLQPAARRALEVIVENGPQVDFSLVQDALDRRGPALAGSLASIGAAWKALHAPEPPFRADHHHHRYVMDSAVRDALAAVLAESRPATGQEN